jgi:hypothetical protein
LVDHHLHHQHQVAAARRRQLPRRLCAAVVRGMQHQPAAALSAPPAPMPAWQCSLIGRLPGASHCAAQWALPPTDP